MTVILQNRLRPGRILETLVGLTDHRITAIRIAVAYTTYAGSSLLVSRLGMSIGNDIWGSIPKTVVTSFDFGITEPQALEFLVNIPNCVVRIANTHVVSHGLRPSVSFHPKIYIFNKGNVCSAVVGSANLTASALTSNTEVVYVDESIIDVPLLDGQWNRILAESLVLSQEILNTYQQVRNITDVAIEQNERISSEIEDLVDIPVFADKVISGDLDPAEFDHLWVEAGSMSSGGSRNQLELPRGAHRFFGFNFSNYANTSVERIGIPTLIARGNRWTNRKLTWHGDNRMERINLPTENQGGFDYQNTAVLFRRVNQGFELEVAPWTDPLSISWQNASVTIGRVYSLGARSNRRYGLF